MNTVLPPRSTPYVATSAPVSPMRQAVAGLVVSIVSVVSLLLGLNVELPPELALAFVSAAFGAYGVIMDRRARREQAAGVPLLEAARAEMPPS